jgi:hypothetical protein
VPADRRAGPVLRAIGLVAAVAALALLPIDPIAAQQRDAVAIEGVVIDATTRNPVGGARIVVSRNRGVTTDSVGVFRLTGLDEGDHLVLVESFGYESVHVTATAGVGLPRIEIPLSPAPMVLAGLSVEVVARNDATMDDRIRLRRDAAAVSVRAIDQDRLLRSGARNRLELLQFEASLHPEPCSGGRVSSGWCVTRRGSMVKPTVFIDEAPAIGGLDELATYRPHEVYLVEVWSGGSTIRAYTNQFMERMGRRPVQLIYGW